jgi:integrase
MRVSVIGYGDLERALPDLSPKLRANVLGAFRSFLRWLWRQGELREMPPFPELAVPRKAPKLISIEQQEAVLEAIQAPRRGIFLALAELVIRPGEARALNVGDYDWETRELRIESAMKGGHQSAPRRGTKTGTTMVRYTSDRLHSWLLEYVPPLVRRNTEVPLFRNPNAPPARSRWSHSTLDAAWRSACRRVGIEIGVYNGCMHSTLAALRAAGVPLADLQEIRGHGWIETTRGYAPLDPARMREQLLRRLPPI